MNAGTKLTITGIIVLICASLPAGLFIALWNYAMNNIPQAETALKIAVTIGCLLLGGWATLVVGFVATSLAVLVITFFE